MGNQFQALLSQLPGWVTTDRFDIEARAEGNPTKDQMRLMMRSLLADRFNLGIHYETRQVPVFALVLSKPGTTGPQLRSHPADASCPTVAQPGPGAVPTIAGGLPELCAGLFPLAPSAPGRTRVGARNVGMGFIASSLSGVGNLGRPVLDQTELSGTFDFTLEWTPELTAPLPPGSDFQPDPSGPTLMEALKEQLGLKLESQKGPVDVIVVDHVEHPTEN